jgi:hypothetical protein
LTIAGDEAQTSLTVRAAAKDDAGKYGDAAVTVLLPVVNSVSVSGPASADRGTTAQFNEDVVFNDDANIPAAVSRSVNWSVARQSGQKKTGTSINGSGVLTIAGDEEAGNLVITATSVYNFSASGTAVIAVTVPSSLPEVLQVEVSPQSATLLRGETHTFSANVSVSGGAETTVNWTVTGKNSASTGITGNGVLSIGTDETAVTLTVRATSTVTGFESKYGEAVVTVPAPVQLAAVSSFSLSGQGAASWDAIASETGVVKYSVQLYKGGAAQGAAVDVNKGASYTHNFLSAMRAAGTGTYTIRVTTIGDGINYTNSPESADSGAQTVEKRPAVQYMWWDFDTARWVNPDGSGDYSVQLYRNGSPAGSALDVARQNTDNGNNETRTAYDFAALKKINGTGLYAIKITAKGDSYLRFDSDESALSLTTAYSPFGNSKVWSIAYGGGVYVAGADQGKIAYSSDGVHWDLSSQSVFGTGDAIRGIAHNGSRFVAAGYNGKIAYSDDGEDWTAANGDPFGGSSILTVAWGSGKFIAAGDGGKVRSSVNGDTWDEISGWNSSSTILDGENILILLYTGSQFAAFGGQQGRIAVSTSGTDGWTWIDNHLNGASRTLKSGAFGKGKFVIVDSSNTHLATTSALAIGDNVTIWAWAEHQIGTTIEAVAFGSDKFIAFGGNGKVSTSTDGSTWSPVNVGEGSGESQFIDKENISAAGFGNGKFILHGNRYEQWAGQPNDNANMGKIAVIPEGNF